MKIQMASLRLDDPEPLTASIGDTLDAKGTLKTKEVEVENFTRRLPCDLSDSEIISKSRQAYRLGKDIEAERTQIDLAKSTYEGVKKSCEGRIAGLDAERSRLMQEVNDGKEYRDTQCQRVRDWKLGEVRELRIDVSPPFELDKRPMTGPERQKEIDYDAYASEPDEEESEEQDFD